MLKIRISGSLKELQQVVAEIKDGKIKQFKHNNGNKTYAIDSKISVEDFLASNKEPENEPKTHAEKMKVLNKELNEELSDLLKVIND
ncbi:MAG: hypothetical protein QM479_01600 [Pseudomonadota bacterium]